MYEYFTYLFGVKFSMRVGQPKVRAGSKFCARVKSKPDSTVSQLRIYYLESRPL